GSTQMAVGNQLINRPEGGTYMRPVPSILAVVHADSLAFPKTIYYEKIIDTADPACDLVGLGWFASANAGYWGGTAAMLNTIGTGDRYAKFRLNVNAPAQYELFAWWVAASNRCKNTPFIVNHASGSDTVRLDQTINGSTWNRIGSYNLIGDSSEAIIISNAGTVGSYIVADAVRVISYDSVTATSVAAKENRKPLPLSLQILNYPNPFNTVTKIRFWLPQTSPVKIKLIDLLGKEKKLLLEGTLSDGSHEVEVDGHDLASGIYFCHIEWGGQRQTHKLLLLK
ncbi:MAG: T9SS type A sorting domain-containing protein, partial [candidate division KSB1 bacterium]|nr:T9SS type A sorting domain-containing protein [candidate division KSB1 bacterium]